MQVIICDYCLHEGKITEANTELDVSNTVKIGTCRNHSKKCVDDIKGGCNSENWYSMISIMGSNIKKRGKIFNKGSKT